MDGYLYFISKIIYSYHMCHLKSTQTKFVLKTKSPKKLESMGGINTLFSSEKIFDIWLGRRGPILFRALLDVFEIRVQYGTQITTSVGKSKTRNRNSSRKSVCVTYWESTGPVHMRPLVWLLVSFLLLFKKKNCQEAT